MNKYIPISKDLVESGDEIQLAGGAYYLVAEVIDTYNYEISENAITKFRLQIEGDKYQNIETDSPIITGAQRKLNGLWIDRDTNILDAMPIVKKLVEAYLQKKYGKPPTDEEPYKVFYSKDPLPEGYTATTYILYYNPDEEIWMDLQWYDLENGDIWMPQPDKPYTEYKHPN